MAEEPKYVFAVSELRRILVEFYMLGRSQHHYSMPMDIAEDNVDGWLEANGSDFQLENGDNRGPSGPEVLSEVELLDKEHETDLRDDILSDNTPDGWIP